MRGEQPKKNGVFNERLELIIDRRRKAALALSSELALLSKQLRAEEAILKELEFLRDGAEEPEERVARAKSQSTDRPGEILANFLTKLKPGDEFNTRDLVRVGILQKSATYYLNKALKAKEIVLARKESMDGSPPLNIYAKK